MLPMGWASAVGVMRVMQELATNLFLQSKLEIEKQVVRSKAIPSWLVEGLKDSQAEQKGRRHTYLDNFFIGQKVRKGAPGYDSRRLHLEAEIAWELYGVLSSKKKKVEGAVRVEELGAAMQCLEKNNPSELVWKG